jgi:hypothetical protein
MPVSVVCGACGTSFKLPPEIYERRIKGRKVSLRCKKCKGEILVDGTKHDDDTMVVAVAPDGAVPAVETNLSFVPQIPTTETSIKEPPVTARSSDPEILPRDASWFPSGEAAVPPVVVQAAAPPPVVSAPAVYPQPPSEPPGREPMETPRVPIAVGREAMPTPRNLEANALDASAPGATFDAPEPPTKPGTSEAVVAERAAASKTPRTPEAANTPNAAEVTAPAASATPRAADVRSSPQAALRPKLAPRPEQQARPNQGFSKPELPSRPKGEKPELPSRPKQEQPKPEVPSRPKAEFSKPEVPSRPKAEFSKPEVPSRSKGEKPELPPRPKQESRPSLETRAEPPPRPKQESRPRVQSEPRLAPPSPEDEARARAVAVQAVAKALASTEMETKAPAPAPEPARAFPAGPAPAASAVAAVAEPRSISLPPARPSLPPGKRWATITVLAAVLVVALVVLGWLLSTVSSQSSVSTTPAVSGGASVTAPTGPPAGTAEEAEEEDEAAEAQGSPARAPVAASGAPATIPPSGSSPGLLEQFVSNINSQADHKSFDRAAALKALDAAANRASRCRSKGDPPGGVTVLVVFNPSGTVKEARVVDTRYDGRPTARCIASRMATARIRPFEGGPKTLAKSVMIP